MVPVAPLTALAATCGDRTVTDPLILAAPTSLVIVAAPRADAVDSPAAITTTTAADGSAAHGQPPGRRLPTMISSLMPGVGELRSGDFDTAAKCGSVPDIDLQRQRQRLAYFKEPLHNGISSHLDSVSGLFYVDNFRTRWTSASLRLSNNSSLD